MVTLALGISVYVLGLCIGSFLNVVVYRLPRGLRVSQPIWSFCPACQATLKWYDNIPVVSWMLLRARCRYCGKPISPQYPLIEAATGLAFVLVHYLLVVAHARVGASDATLAAYVHPDWQRDAALLLAWLILAAVLVACSVMDLIFYVIDTRLTDVALLGGIVGYAFWPAQGAFHLHSADPAAAAAFAAACISGVMIWRSNRASPDSDHKDAFGEDPVTKPLEAGSMATDRAAVTLAVLLFVGLAVWILTAHALGGSEAPIPYRRYLVPAALLAFFVAMVLTGGQTRPIDDELHAAIEAEAPAARRNALRECLWLTPAVGGAVLVYGLVRFIPWAGDLWTLFVGWRPGAGLEPVSGVVFALQGAVIAAAAGWVIRIFFTLAFGREAFGTGDIYILAAAGAIAGWDLALLGFLLAIPIALLGWLISLVLKRTGMIPFGPPLALGFITALWLNGPAAIAVNGYKSLLVRAWQDQRGVVLLSIGLLIVVLPLAIFLARLARRFVEPASEHRPSEE